jgi:hypothetical protein
MNGTTIVAYLYGGHIHCPQCIHELFLPFDLIGGNDQSTERVLDLVASQRRLNRQDTQSYSAYQFPVPLYNADVSTAETCNLCGRRLLEPL